MLTPEPHNTLERKPKNIAAEKYLKNSVRSKISPRNFNISKSLITLLFCNYFTKYISKILG